VKLINVCGVMPMLTVLRGNANVIQVSMVTVDTVTVFQELPSLHPHNQQLLRQRRVAMTTRVKMVERVSMNHTVILSVYVEMHTREKTVNIK